MRRLALLTVLLPSLAHAQSDQAAGLFAEARQIPITAQSVSVQLRPTDAEISLRQTFFNNGVGVAQADYHAHLPTGASLLGFGFWHEGKFNEAKLAAKDEAEANHARAAAEGRTTGIVKSEGSIHSFSVYPLDAYGAKRIATRFSMPVVREMGRSHVRIPVDRFVGQDAPSTTVVVHLTTDNPIEAIGVDGAEHVTVNESSKGARIVFSTKQPVDVWWREAGPPLSIRGQAVRIDDHDVFAVDLRFMLNDAGRSESKPVVAFVDGSSSMRRRAAAAAELIRRIGVHTDVDVHVFAEKVKPADPRALTSLIRSGAVGHAASPAALLQARRQLCEKKRCIVVTDPSFAGLKDAAREEMSIVLLADAHEMAFFREKIPNGAIDYRIDAPSRAALHAVADGLVLPSLSIVSLEQNGASLDVTTPGARKVVEGGVLRLMATSDAVGPVALTGRIGKKKIRKVIRVEKLAASADDAKRVRREYFRGYLDKEMKKYRKLPTPELREQIIATSIRENVPTDLTALQVSAPSSDPALYASKGGGSKYSLFGGSSAPEPAEWAAFMLLLVLATWAARRKSLV